MGKLRYFLYYFQLLRQRYSRLSRLSVSPALIYNASPEWYCITTHRAQDTGLITIETPTIIKLRSVPPRVRITRNKKFKFRDKGKILSRQARPNTPFLRFRCLEINLILMSNFEKQPVYYCIVKVIVSRKITLYFIIPAMFLCLETIFF